LVLRAAVKTAIGKYGYEVIGFKDGYQGLVLRWASIDNDDSRDLDQLTVAAAAPDDKVKILVAVADVDSLVKNGSAIDVNACHNTTSVYTAAGIFPMLPEKLSTNLTSLNFNEDRLAIIVEMLIGADGFLQSSNVYRACVRNHAKLIYNSVAIWLEGSEVVPETNFMITFGLVSSIFYWSPSEILERQMFSRNTFP
jgi:exoribonuclease R